MKVTLSLAPLASSSLTYPDFTLGSLVKTKNQHPAGVGTGLPDRKAAFKGSLSMIEFIWKISADRSTAVSSIFSTSSNESQASEDRDGDWTSSNALTGMRHSSDKSQKSQSPEIPSTILNHPFYINPKYSYELGRAWSSGAASIHLGLWPRSSRLFSERGIWHLQTRWHEWDCAQSSPAEDDFTRNIEV